MDLHRELERQLELSGYDADGFAERYYIYRPRTPVALVELLTALADGAYTASSTSAAVRACRPESGPTQQTT